MLSNARSGLVDHENIHWYYEVTDAEAVAAILSREPRLLPVLAEARSEINAAFWPGVPVVLEVIADPEEGDSALFARIFAAIPLDEALQRLDMLWSRWGLDAMSQTNGSFHLDIQLS